MSLLAAGQSSLYYLEMFIMAVIVRTARRCGSKPFSGILLRSLFKIKSSNSRIRIQQRKLCTFPIRLKERVLFVFNYPIGKCLRTAGLAYSLAECVEGIMVTFQVRFIHISLVSLKNLTCLQMSYRMKTRRMTC